MITGYKIPGSNKGQALTLPDFCYGLVGEVEAGDIVECLRQSTGKEPSWQSVHGKLIKLVKAKGGVQ
jgi:hypothetical protein